jgi:hypothetical protein
MKYYAKSSMALRRSDGVLEYWSVGKIFLKRFLSALLQYSKGVGFKHKTEAEGNMARKR